MNKPLILTQIATIIIGIAVIILGLIEICE
jgi:hypothetical protein